MIELGDYDTVCRAMKVARTEANKTASGNATQREHHKLRAMMLAVLEAERGTPSTVIHQSARDLERRKYSGNNGKKAA